MRKSHECHSEQQAKNLAFPATYENEILRLSPQDDIATQSLKGEEITRRETLIIDAGICPSVETGQQQCNKNVNSVQADKTKEDMNHGIGHRRN